MPGVNSPAHALLQNAFAVNHRSDDNFLSFESVDNAITVDEQFSDVLVIEFRGPCVQRAESVPVSWFDSLPF